MQRMLVKYCYKKKEEWATYLDNCVFAYNTSRHESSGFTPFQLMFNRQATLPIDINVRKASSEEVAVKYANLQDPDQDELQRIWTAQLDTAKANIKKAQEKQKLAFDKKHSNPDLFKKGQLVFYISCSHSRCIPAHFTRWDECAKGDRCTHQAIQARQFCEY